MRDRIPGDPPRRGPGAPPLRRTDERGPPAPPQPPEHLEGESVAYVPNQVVSASRNPASVPSPTHATYPSGLISTASGAATWPRTGSSQSPAYSASIGFTRAAHGV